jgi:HEAT repeat protein
MSPGKQFSLVSENSGKMHQQRRSRFWRRWLTRWLISRLRTRSLEIRTYILQALGKIGDETALPVILGAATDADSTIRRFAVSALADQGGTRAIYALIAALDDLESDVRVAAVMGLGELGDIQAEEALVALLDDGETSVRTQAIIALGHLTSRRALPLLSQMMDTESNEWTRRYITQAIREIEGGCCS